MIIPIVTDIHFQASGMFSHPVEQGLTTRAEISFDFMRWFKRLCDKEKAKLVLCAGDIFSQKNLIPVPLYNKALDLLLEFCEGKIRRDIFTIVGNHDRYMKSQDADLHSLYVLSRASPHLKILPEPTESITTKMHGNAQVEIIGIPAGYAGDFDFPERRGFTKRRILLIHENIVGAAFPNGMLVKDGLGKREMFNLMRDNEIDICFCGDIHKGQAFVESGKKTITTDWDETSHVVPRRGNCLIVLPGAPYQMNFGDEGQARGVCLYNTDDNSVEFVKYREGPKYFTVTDKNFIQEIKRSRKGNWFLRFKISNPKNQARYEELRESFDEYRKFTTLEYTLRVREKELTPSDIGADKSIIREYVAASGPEKGASMLIKMGEKYFDAAQASMN